jgi:hypothetical protein
MRVFGAGATPGQAEFADLSLIFHGDAASLPE